MTRPVTCDGNGGRAGWLGAGLGFMRKSAPSLKVKAPRLAGESKLRRLQT